MCEDDIVITSILQSYILYWYHKYLPYPGIDVAALKKVVVAKHKCERPRLICILS